MIILYYLWPEFHTGPEMGLDQMNARFQFNF